MSDPGLGWPSSAGPTTPAIAPEHRTSSSPSLRTIIGVGVLILGVGMTAIGMHHVISVGTCSSTGFSEYGPVPTCPSGAGLYIGYLIGGIFLSVIGGLVGPGAGSLAGAAVFVGIGFGALSTGLGPWSQDDGRGFAITFGGGFAVAGVLWTLAALAGGRAVRRVVSTTATSTFMPRPMGTTRNVVDEIQRLAALHNSGALTDAEFEQAKQRALRGG